MDELFKGILDSLSDAQKEKARACKDTKSLLDLLASEGVALPDELLDAVAGGKGGMIGPGGTVIYYVTDDTYR